ncbi:MAG: hypothetical protein QM539_04410 [Alphaproteobacteria bacterium]|nr:hypothetical protein [Alphaproteobacteria bacterium]
MSNLEQNKPFNVSISGFLRENRIIILLLFFIILFDYDLYKNWYQKYSDSWFNYIAFILQSFTIYEILNVVSERRKTQSMAEQLKSITDSLYTKYIPGDRYLNDVTDLIKNAKKSIYIVKSTLTPEYHTAEPKFIAYKDALDKKIEELTKCSIEIKCLDRNNMLQGLKQNRLTDCQLKNILIKWNEVCKDNENNKISFSCLSEVPIQVWIIDRDEPDRVAIFTIQKTNTSTDYGFITKDPQLIEVLYKMTGGT